MQLIERHFSRRKSLDENAFPPLLPCVTSIIRIFGRRPVIIQLVIFHNGYDRNANARILAAFCYGQQSRNVGVARGAGRTGEIRQNFSVAGQITAGPTSKIKDARISDADARARARSNSVAISSILHSERKSFGRNKSEQRDRPTARIRPGIRRRASTSTERGRHNSTRFLSPASSKFKSSVDEENDRGRDNPRMRDAKNLARFAFLTPAELEAEGISE